MRSSGRGLMQCVGNIDDGNYYESAANGNEAPKSMHYIIICKNFHVKYPMRDMWPPIPAV
jgi:hypothetical protein